MSCSRPDRAGPPAISAEREALAERLPGAVQPFVTWLSGLQARSQPAPARLSPLGVLALGVLSILTGFVLVGLAIGGPLWLVIPAYLLGFAFLAGGMRRLDVLVIHQTLHAKVLGSERADRILGEILTTLLLRTPFLANRKSHLLHHRTPCDERDDDVVFLRRAGVSAAASARALFARIAAICLSPAFHGRLVLERLYANFIVARPLYRLAMSWAYAALLLAPAFWFGTGWLLTLALFWLLPLTVGMQISNFLYTATKHRWWLFSNRTVREREKRDLLSYTRVCCAPAPSSGGPGGWAVWWLQAVLLHLPVRLFIVVGDTMHHDLHHIAPNCDWPNSTAERPTYLARWPGRFSEVWGGLPAHLKECNLAGPSSAQALAGASPAEAGRRRSSSQTMEIET